MIGVERWDGVSEDLTTRTVWPAVKDVPEEINGCIYDFGRYQSAVAPSNEVCFGQKR